VIDMTLLTGLFGSFWGGTQGLVLLVVRFVVGVAFILHGLPKIQNPFGWMGAMGSSVPSFLQAIAAFAEFGGGIALILGLLTPIAAFGLICQMIAALVLVHLPAGHPFVAGQPGAPSYETALIYLAISLAILVFGPGKYSVDAWLFTRQFHVSPGTLRESRT
jgi:putative oxidoreductase